MPAKTAFSVVRGPRYTPLPHGLLSAAQVEDDSDSHWQAGTLYNPEPCGPSHAVSTFCETNGMPEGTAAKTPTDDGAPFSAAEPFTIYAYADCAPVGWGTDMTELEARATRQLDSGEARAVEHVFWTGQPDQGDPIHPHLAANAQVLANNHGDNEVELQSAATVLDGGSVVESISQIEGALAECYGGEGVIHVPFAAVAYLSHLGLVKAQGPVLKTFAGHKVAAYSSGNISGPDGVDPAGFTFYGTGAVTARRSQIKPKGMRPADYLNINDNSTVYVVERTYVLDWDCCHFAATVTPGTTP